MFLLHIKTFFTIPIISKCGKTLRHLQNHCPPVVYPFIPNSTTTLSPLCDVHRCTTNKLFTSLSQRILLGPSANHPQVVNAPDLRITHSKDSYHVGDTVDVYCQSSEPGVIASWSRPYGRFAENVQTSSGSLRIYNVQPENSGVYRCEATGFRGTYHKDFTFDVIDSNEDKNPPFEVQAAPQGSSVLLKCQTELRGDVNYEWEKQDGQLPSYIDNKNSVRCVEMDYCQKVIKIKLVTAIDSIG